MLTYVNLWTMKTTMEQKKKPINRCSCLRGSSGIQWHPVAPAAMAAPPPVGAIVFMCPEGDRKTMWDDITKLYKKNDVL